MLILGGKERYLRRRGKIEKSSQERPFDVKKFSSRILFVELISKFFGKKL